MLKQSIHLSLLIFTIVLFFSCKNNNKIEEQNNTQNTTSNQDRYFGIVDKCLEKRTHFESVLYEIILRTFAFISPTS